MDERETLRQLLEEAECEDVDEYLGVLSNELDRSVRAHLDTIDVVVRETAVRIDRLRAVISQIQIAPSEEA